MLMVLATIHFSTSVLAQSPEQVNTVRNPPLNMEGIFGNRGMVYQLLVIKKFQSAPKFGFFSVSNMVAEWQRKPIDDVMTQSNLSYSITKGIDIVAGFIYTSVNGFRPSAGLLFQKGSPDYLLVIAPRAELSRNATAETMVLAEYKPVLNTNWRLYTRLQGLYGLTLNSGNHARSYAMARMGVKFKEFAFGAGSNFDWYGPSKQYAYNIGGFVNIDLF